MPPGGHRVEAAIARRFGGRPSDEQARDLAELIAARHPQYGGGFLKPASGRFSSP